MRFVVTGVLVALAAGAGAVSDSRAAACSPDGKDVVIGGKSATVYCGPAKATVHVGGQMMTFRGGMCVWTANSFKLQLGTIFLFRAKPLQSQPGFSIYATGVPVAKALIQVYSQGTYSEASPVYATARPTGAQAGGSFQGKTGKKGTGPAISGTIAC
jgi:hypothetical protein